MPEAVSICLSISKLQNNKGSLRDAPKMTMTMSGLGTGPRKVTQIQNTEMQKYKLHICKNRNYSVVVVVLVVEV